MRVYHTRVATLWRIPSVDDQIDSDRQLGDPPWGLGAWDFRHFVPVAVANDNKKNMEGPLSVSKLNSSWDMKATLLIIDKSATQFIDSTSTAYRARIRVSHRVSGSNSVCLSNRTSDERNRYCMGVGHERVRQLLVKQTIPPFWAIALKVTVVPTTNNL